jgi:hypothetical protein
VHTSSPGHLDKVWSHLKREHGDQAAMINPWRVWVYGRAATGQFGAESQKKIVGGEQLRLLLARAAAALLFGLLLTFPLACAVLCLPACSHKEDCAGRVRGVVRPEPGRAG